jgi:tetratricopeptide (TPR) repeat protein
MSDYDRGLAVAKQAFDLWQQGSLEEAAALYEEALPLLDSARCWTPQVHSEYAAVLAALGRSEQARVQWLRCVDIELRRDPSGTSASAVVARYFLGEQCLRCGDAASALEAVAPALGTAGKLEALVRLVQANALAMLERRDEAMQTAEMALSASGSDEQRERIRARLDEALGRDWRVSRAATPPTDSRGR